MIALHARLLLLLHVSSSILTVTALKVNWANYGNGLHFDETCAPFRVRLDEAVVSAINLIDIGWKSAKSPDNPIYEDYFRPQDAQIVRRTFVNLKKSLYGQTGNVTVGCLEDEFCTRLRITGYNVRNGESTHINICKHALEDGPRSKPVRNDYCTQTSYETLDTSLLHEMIHDPRIGPDVPKGVREFYSSSDCQYLAKGEIKDAESKVMSPTDNPSSYLHMAEEMLYWIYSMDPANCPSNDKTELRRLKGDKSVTSLANGTVTSFDIAADDTILTPNDIKVPSKDEPILSAGPYTLPNANVTFGGFIPPVNSTDGP